MFDPQRLLGQMLGDALGGGYGRRKKHRDSGGFGGGGLLNKATLGVGLLGVAYAAWEHYRTKGGASPATAASPTPTASTGMPPAPPPAAASVTPPPPPAAASQGGAAADEALTPAQQDALTLVRAMIAAAHADGLLDSEEREAILGRAREAGLDADALRRLESELRSPLSPERLLATARDGLAPEIYAASLLAIRIDTPAERAYLDALAGALGLDAAQREDVHRTLGLDL